MEYAKKAYETDIFLFHTLLIFEVLVKRVDLTFVVRLYCTLRKKQHP